VTESLEKSTSSRCGPGGSYQEFVEEGNVCPKCAREHWLAARERELLATS